MSIEIVKDPKEAEAVTAFLSDPFGYAIGETLSEGSVEGLMELSKKVQALAGSLPKDIVEDDGVTDRTFIRVLEETTKLELHGLVATPEELRGISLTEKGRLIFLASDHLLKTINPTDSAT